MLAELFDQESIKAIKNLPLWSFDKEDSWAWSIKSAYRLTVDNDNVNVTNSLENRIWKTDIHERLKMHMWRIASNLLPTKDQINWFAINSDLKCPLCNFEIETSLHLFIQCHFARAIWYGNGCQWNLRLDCLQLHSVSEFIEVILDPRLDLNLDDLGLEKQSAT